MATHRRDRCAARRRHVVRKIQSLVFEQAELVDDEDYVHSIIAADDVPDAHLDEGSTDDDLDNTFVLHDDFYRMAGFQA